MNRYSKEFELSNYSIIDNNVFIDNFIKNNDIKSLLYARRLSKTKSVNYIIKIRIVHLEDA